MEEVDAMTRQLKLTGPLIWTQGWTGRKTSAGLLRQYAGCANYLLLQEQRESDSQYRVNM